MRFGQRVRGVSALAIIPALCLTMPGNTGRVSEHASRMAVLPSQEVRHMAATAMRSGQHPGLGAGLWRQQAKLVASDAITDDNFGDAVAIEGSTALIAARDKDGLTGAVYVFERSGSRWTQQAELTAHGGAQADAFGWSLALSGDTAVIGAIGANHLSGAVYVFVRSGGAWVQQAELTASDATQFAGFGWSVAVDGSTLVVGDPNRNGSGVAYVFTRRQGVWTQQAELTDPQNTTFDSFGFSVAATTSTIVVGAQGTRNNTGAVYVYTSSGTTWTRQATLTASDGAPSDSFGAALAITGTTLIAGAIGKNRETGAAYVFERIGVTWMQQAELTATDGRLLAQFGDAVAIDGPILVIAAATKRMNTGAVYVFRRFGAAWYQRAELTAADAAPFAYVGTSVAISGSTIVAGAIGVNDNAGAAYVFARST